MSDQSRELFNSFGKLMQNRVFLMAVAHQHDMAGMGGHHGTGRGQLRLLQLLAESPAGLTNAEIAEILDIRPSSVSATINRLEEVGLVERVPSKTDKRVVIVRLSEKGQKMADHRDQGVDDLSDQLFGCLSADEQVMLQKLLDKLAQHAPELDLHDFMTNQRDHDWPQRPGWGRRWF
ncbi:MarR family transcriptional regulator [Lactiplantibacillus sp. WILCCON 0030]|uniref:MarR family transcriptional regulator n=1 Tax=Lactiplantibacillus brownii TaxID=3069269 RepID=A0ABU1ABE4_9LACO|nr:MarR family transcriptional regulator [Lactiplantibacillus brownii]MDQ7938294.1 MarR family transcriptional regulator [Lactiplantibacillus brownii]